jgi:hypothetical protein
MVSAMSDIQRIVESFTSQLTALIEAETLSQARSAVFAALGGSGPVAKRRGRPPNGLQVAPVPHVGVAKAPAMKPRKKAPRQLCPVPGCTNPAAPVFGMVCAKHKNVAKSKIKKYREARKAKKLGLKPGKARKATGKKPGRPKRRTATAPATAPATAAAA